MSATHAPTTPGTFLCPRCGSRLRDDQSWCLECGLAARTRIHPPPSWRVPVILTCVLLVLLAAGIAVGLAALLDDEPQPPPAATTVTVPAATATAPATTPSVPAATVPTTSVPQATVPTSPTPAPGARTAPTIPATPKTLTIPRGRVPATGGAGAVK